MEDPLDVERAQAFWSSVDVEQVFDDIDERLCNLRYSISHRTATDTEYLRARAVLALLGIEATIQNPEPDQNNSTIYPVVISTVGASQAGDPLSPPPPAAAAAAVLLTNGLTDPRSPPVQHAGDQEDAPVASLPPLPPYRPHDCSPACMSQCDSVSLWGENPLRLPESCGFKRLLVGWRSSAPDGEELDGHADGQEDGEDQPEAVAGVPGGVVYRAPCGASLHSHDDVMRFLLVTDTFHLLQVDFFSFNWAVGLDPPQPAAVARPPEKDLSQGLEPTAVELCPAADGSRPADFRYRKERWPHGCFLGRGPRLYRACCDCTDGCADPAVCACAGLTAGGRNYQHNRLSQPVPEGLYECGPWCGCVRSRCQNRVVQRGLTVRLQVFQTSRRRRRVWGVRCKDSLDAGTFICTYAGLVLIRGAEAAADEAPPPKQARKGAELPWDDEVEVVTEWLAPTARPTSPPLHVVPVIQRPSETQQTQQQSQTHCATADQSGEETAMSAEPRKPIRAEDMYFLDATREGNVGRFINQSCDPNLFVQNVFTDTHDPGYPVICFFTNRVLEAGTELTWQYSPDTGSPPSDQEVACQCGSDGCRGKLLLSQQEPM